MNLVASGRVTISGGHITGRRLASRFSTLMVLYEKYLINTTITISATLSQQLAARTLIALPYLYGQVGSISIVLSCGAS